MTDRYNPDRRMAHARGRPSGSRCDDHPNAAPILDITGPEDSQGRLPLVCPACVRGDGPDTAVAEAHQAQQDRWAAAEADPDTAYNRRRPDRLYRKEPPS